MAQKKHHLELLVDLLVEAIEEKVDRTVETLSMGDGRPIFGKLLSDQEKLNRWLMPELRSQMEQKVLQTEGNEGLAKYQNEMATLQGRLGG